jgi:arylsulfatase A-like enzyme
LALGLATSGCFEAAHERAPHVFLITVDTLRADRLGAYGSSRNLTPRLDALAETSLVFDRAYSTAPLTLPSVSSLLTGRHPAVTGVASNFGIVPETLPTLASRLRSHGWKTGAVVSNFALRPTTKLDRGFDRYDDQLDSVELNRSQPERIAGETRAAALRLLDELAATEGQPVFLWVHFQDPHGPYTPPDGYLERTIEAARAEPDASRKLPVASSLSGVGAIPTYQVLGNQREAAFYRANYDAEVLYTDTEIGALLDGIEDRGLLEEAIVIFATDHGEGLGESNYWFAHGEYLFDPLVQVPLMIRAPGVAPGRRSDLASLLDVFPPLLGLLGLEPETGEGRDLLLDESEPSGLLLFTFKRSKPSRVAVVADGFKYTLTRSGEAPQEDLHRLGDESRNLAEEQPERLASLRTLLRTLREQLPPRIGRSRRQNPSEVEKARLQALGYVEEP